MEIKNGDIIRLKSDEGRDWVAISSTKCKHINNKKKKKEVFYLLAGLWYPGDPTTDEPYGKCIGTINPGMYSDMTVIGNINHKKDYEKYKLDERL